MNKLRILGGKYPQECTRRILSRLITNDLAKQLNWIGCGVKKSIQEYPHILQLICGLYIYFPDKNFHCFTKIYSSVFDASSII